MKEMKVGYVRCVFPKLTETFIAEEVMYLKSKASRIRVYVMRCEVSYISSTIQESGVLKDIHVEYPRLTPLRACTKLFATLRDFVLRPSAVVDFVRPLISIEVLRLEIAEIVAKSNHSVFMRLVSSGRAAWKIMSYSLVTRNLTIAINQYILSRERFVPDVLYCPFTFMWDTFKMHDLRRQFVQIPYAIALRSRDMYTSWHSEPHAVLKKKLIIEAHNVVTISKYNCSLLGAHINSAKLRVIHSSIDTAKFSPSSVAIARKRPLVLSVARLVPKKGLEHLIRACAILRDQALDFDCCIVGDGPSRGALQKLCRRLSISDRVRLLGPCGAGEVLRLLSQSQLFVLPCIIAADGDRDMVPNSLKEAMAMNIAVISTNIPGMDELISDGKNGFLVQPGSAEAIADKMSLLLQNRALRERVGYQGREKIVANYNIKHEGEKLYALLNNLDRTPCSGVGGVQNNT